MALPEKVEYAEGFEFFDRPVRRLDANGRMPGQDEDGYGRKITTDRVVRFPGSTRTYRVFCTCWSNSPSFWIMKDGKQLFFRATAFL